MFRFGASFIAAIGSETKITLLDLYSIEQFTSVATVSFRTEISETTPNNTSFWPYLLYQVAIDIDNC
ncbi:hypothetical protein SAMN05216386_1873 [Nitrosospira briensis]|uniref:Uncharacterized protein n=1 Tax=Nitrosospira briensis TaxID=35799 RepID=A0A1I5BYB7_9PROT|nr:hypothetical protein SAMN05216386_1873 [Nitrosospira briensis]SFO15429.1 hypothetical protein SAMN05216332_10676 [Nitrosospira briensis]